jgi:hypothetical protein
VRDLACPISDLQYFIMLLQAHPGLSWSTLLQRLSQARNESSLASFLRCIISGKLLGRAFGRKGEHFNRERHASGTEIKAITYSNMQIREDAGDAEVFVIVDI